MILTWLSNLTEFYTLCVGLIICSFIAFFIVLLSKLLSDQKIDLEKYSAYECGFDPFGDARHTFNVQFYLVAILFMIFDLEMVFLFPWAVTLNSYQMFYSMMGFLLILVMGFIYEWYKGALDW